MEKQSLTALVSGFARAYHTRHNEVKIFDDPVAERLITQEEYIQISTSMSQGISFFNPDFTGSAEEALRFIVDRFLSPAPLGRAAFAEQMLENAVTEGVRQYLVFAAGLDTFAYRKPKWAENLRVIEIDHPSMSAWKQSRVKNLMDKGVPEVHFVGADFSEGSWPEALSRYPDFNTEEISFCSLLGICYYLTKDQFAKTIAAIGKLVAKGSLIVFDYPVQELSTANTGEQGKKLSMMAGAAGEAMLASYSYREVEDLLSGQSFRVRRHLTTDEITVQYFAEYNAGNIEHPMAAAENVNYCLAVLT